MLENFFSSILTYTVVLYSAHVPAFLVLNLALNALVLDHMRSILKKKKNLRAQLCFFSVLFFSSPLLDVTHIFSTPLYYYRH